MQQIINLVIKYKTTLLYLLLLLISLGFTIQSHSYHHSKFFNSANWISGGIFSMSTSVSSYFDLNEENKSLLEENERLRRLLLNTPTPNELSIDTTAINYTIQTARAIKNAYAGPRNYITIDKGKKQGVTQDMGVITSLGILGIVENTSNNYATVQSILNTRSSINAKLKNTAHFGSLKWNEKQYNVVQLEEIPRLVNLKIGDTIVTGGSSSIFPENIPIGVIQKFDLTTTKNFYNIDIKLFNDMTNIKNVYIISNINQEEIRELEEATKNEQ